MTTVRGGADGLAIRVGHGYDAHPFAKAGDESGRTLVLGGVRFPDERPLEGHSDADVVAHAVIDAMLSAAGVGDIGTHFPDSDERWQGADSVEMLRVIAARLAETGWRLANADCTVICEWPKIAPHRAEMHNVLSAAAGGPVTVCGKRTEGLSTTDGIVAHAVALVTRIFEPELGTQKARDRSEQERQAQGEAVAESAPELDQIGDGGRRRETTRAPSGSHSSLNDQSLREQPRAPESGGPP